MVKKDTTEWQQQKKENGMKTTKPKDQRKMSETARDVKLGRKKLETRRRAEKINTDVKWVNEKQEVKRKFGTQRNEA